MRDHRSSVTAEPTRALAVVRGAAESVPIVGAARRLTLTVEEAAALIGISRAQAYRCVRSGQLRAVRLGRRIVVPVVAVEQLLGTTIRPGAADSAPEPRLEPGSHTAPGRTSPERSASPPRIARAQWGALVGRYEAAGLLTPKPPTGASQQTPPRRTP